jgi:hypothetical protein
VLRWRVLARLGGSLSGVVNHFDHNTLLELGFRHFVDATRSPLCYKCLATVIAVMTPLLQIGQVI